MADQQAQSAAASVAAQVKAILEAAEQSEAAARADAERVHESVARVSERAAELDRRLDELAAGVRDAIAALKDEVEGLRAPAAPVPAAAEDPATRVDPEADDELIAEVEAVAARPPEVEAAPGAPEGARLLALKMALDGRPREETAGYLRENFELDDPDALLDEVYARAGR